MKELELYYKRIIESLKLISIANDENRIKSYFPDFVDLPFEIVDTYHNAFLLIPQLIENNLIPNDIIANLIRLEFLVNHMLGHPEYETLTNDQIFKREQWNVIVNFAQEILRTLDISYSDGPDRNYI